MTPTTSSALVMLSLMHSSRPTERTTVAWHARGGPSPGMRGGLLDIFRPKIEEDHHNFASIEAQAKMP